ncbi:MAG: hypothetical protein NVS3B19_03150 [Ginsengibacter sp.]
MKIKILLNLFILFISIHSFSQKNKAYAITGQQSANLNWVDIREIDLSSGTSIKSIFVSGKNDYKLVHYGGEKVESFSASLSGDGQKSIPNSPTQSMIAAAAYDQKHKKLFFMPIHGGDLNWLDMNDDAEKLSTFYVSPSSLMNINFADEANSITRMCIGADGNGYAISNDGNHLVQFTTGNKTEVKDLGALIDDGKNKGFSVHNKCSSWGGDIVGDVYGKLYLFTSAHNVFVIDVKTRIASMKGTILNLPGTFTTNGAAVDNSDNVIVSSANTFDGYYKVNMNDLKAIKLDTKGQIFNASDLANANLLYQRKADDDLNVPVVSNNEILGNQFVSVYPNPVSGSDVKISFEKMKPGKYALLISDLEGRAILSSDVYLKSGTQIEPLGLNKKPASGMYLIKVTNANNKSVFTDKLVVN